MSQESYYSTTYGCHLLGCLVGEKYRIDFVNRGECVVPNNAAFDVPGEATQMVYIRNDGPAGVYYKINAPNLATIGYSYLGHRKEREFKFSRVNVKSVNIYVAPTDAETSADIVIETLK